MSKIAIVGCDASGKTVLISSLSDYYKAGRRAGQSCIMVPADSLTRRYTDNLHRVMRINGEWPEATSDISVGTTLKWKLMRDGKELADLELLDFGGENFRYAFRNDGTEKNPEAVAQLKDYIAGADFVVITVSMDKMVRNLTPSLYRELENGDIEYDRDAEAQWVTEGLLRMVAAKIASDPPGVVVALTQADKHRKELEEHGGAKALFEKCWPMIATMYPNLDVVPCASIDKMSDKGLPADGYSTEGVLAVMKEFSRYAFGDCDDIEGIRPGATPVATPATPAAAAPAQTEDAAVKPGAAEPSADRMQNVGSAVRIVGLLAILAAVVYFGVKMLSQPQPPPVPPADDTAKELVRTQELAREREEAARERQRLERERARAEQERVREEALRQEQARKAREAEEARKRAEEALAQAQAKARELEEARKAREAEEARKRAEAEQARKAEEARRVREAEEARQRAEAELAKERAAAERARQEKAAAEKAAAEKAAAEKAAAEKAAAEKAAAEKAKVSPDEMLRLRAEEREMKYQELRERQRLEREQMETAGLMTSLVDSVNRAHLERGRNLIADLSGDRKLTSGQRDILDYARTFMDHLEKAQNENADDMVWIGNQYYTAEGSVGIVKSPREALSWYRKAAAIGSSQAYYFMSLMTEQGEGVRKDEALAGRYCLKAARLGNAEAMFWIGVYCNEGTHGFEKSPATAYKFLSMARNAGFENAGLDRLIRRVQDESDGDTIDGWFPDDPLQEPVKPDPKEERPWWKLGIF